MNKKKILKLIPLSVLSIAIPSVLNLSLNTNKKLLGYRKDFKAPEEKHKIDTNSLFSNFTSMEDDEFAKNERLQNRYQVKWSQLCDKGLLYAQDQWVGYHKTGPVKNKITSIVSRPALGSFEVRYEKAYYTNPSNHNSYGWFWYNDKYYLNYLHPREKRNWVIFASNFIEQLIKWDKNNFMEEHKGASFTSLFAEYKVSQKTLEFLNNLETDKDKRVYSGLTEYKNKMFLWGLHDFDCEIEGMYDVRYYSNKVLNNLKYTKVGRFIEALKECVSSDNCLNRFEYGVNKKIDQNHYSIDLLSDTLGDLTTSVDGVFKDNGGKSNIEHLNKIFDKEYEFEYASGIKVKYKYDYKIKNEAVGEKNKIDVYIKVLSVKIDDKEIIDKDLDKILNNIEDWTKENIKAEAVGKWNQFLRVLKDIVLGNFKVFDSLKVNILESDLYKRLSGASLASRLTISTSITNPDGSISQIEAKAKANGGDLKNLIKRDEPERVSNKELEKDFVGKPWFGGRYVVRGPINISFKASEDETEVLMVNKQKVSVLNRIFEKKLIDERINVNDTSKIPFGKNSGSGNGEGDVAKNEYLVEVYRYKKGSNNSGEPEEKYVVIYEVIGNQFKQNIKYYAWDPEKNMDQKQLISPYMLDSKGKELKDKEGKLIVNENYDPSIDKETGTKKQIVWIKNKLFSDELKEQLRFVYPNIKITTDKADFGIYAEANVLGKGALRNLVVDKVLESSSRYYKCLLFRKENDKYVEIDRKEQKLIGIPVNNGTSEYSYMSEEGIWLLFTVNEKSISNVNLVLIDAKSEPKSFFLDSIENKIEKINNQSEDYFEAFLDGSNWITTLFQNYLNEACGIQNDDLGKLGYDEMISLYKNFVDQASKFNVEIGNEYENIFKDKITWGKLENLNGLNYGDETNETIKENYRRQVKEIVLNFVKRNIANSAKLKAIGITENEINGGWVIANWNTPESEKRWLDRALKVYIKDINEPDDDGKGWTFTLRGTGKYINHSITFNLKNSAYHVYYPPIDLSSLDIQKHFKIEMGKNISNDSKELKEKIRNKLIGLIEEQFDLYKNKTGIEMLLNKDIKVEGLDNVLDLLVQGNKFKDGIDIKIKGINANLISSAKIHIINDAEAPVFDLSLLNDTLVKNPIVISQKEPEKITKDIINKLNEITIASGIEFKKDYLVSLVNASFYLLSLVADIDKLNEAKYEKFKKVYEETKAKVMAEYNTWEIEGHKVPIPYQINDTELFKKYHEALEKAIKEVENDNFNKSLDYKARGKYFVLLPVKEGNNINFAYAIVVNNIDANYNAFDDELWFKEIQNDKHKKPNGEDLDVDKTKASHKSNYWIWIVSVMLALGLAVGGIYGIRWYLNKKGFKAGKSKKQVAIKKFKEIQIYKKDRIKAKPVVLSDEEINKLFVK